ncbi:MAG: phospholipid carrier-dependent glycosyltransferase [Anaerolineae bacterium]|nr:phospholipid carrier-dependent glycosyltransferase [Anaerolineae bacterium]
MDGDGDSGRRLDISLLLLLFMIAVLLRLLFLLLSGFDGLYGQDAYAYYDFAKELRTAFVNGHTPPPFFWPLGYPMLLVGLFAAFGGSAGGAQGLNVLLGAVLSPLVYVLARQLGVGRFGALAAGTLMAFCGQALQSSLVVMSDVPALFWATSSAVVLWLYLNAADQSSRVQRLMLSAMLLALAAVTRWIYVLLMLPWGLTLLLSGKLPWRAGAAAVMMAGLLLLPQVIYSGVTAQPAVKHAWVSEWAAENAFRSTFDNAEGHFAYQQINAAFFAQAYLAPYYLSPLFAIFALIGVWRWRKQGERMAMLLGWALLPYLFLIGLPSQNIRFPLIVIPPTVVLAGAGLESLVVWRGWRRPVIGYALVVLLLCIGLRQMGQTAGTTVTDFITRQQAEKQVAQWAAAYIPPDATVYSFGLTLILRHETACNVIELYYESPDSLDARWQRGREDYLLVNGWNIENQWAGRSPQIAFRWLQETRGIIRYGRFGNYTLYKIRG